MQPGDLVRITRPSIGIPKDSLGLVVEQRLMMTSEPGRDSYFLYHVQTLDGKVRRFTSDRLKKVTPDLYST